MKVIITRIKDCGEMVEFKMVMSKIKYKLFPLSIGENDIEIFTQPRE